MNAFRPPPAPSLTCNSPDARQMALSMIRKSQENRNLLIERVEHSMLSSRGKWRPLDAPDAAPDIPVLSVSSMRAFTFGLYQLKQAASYTREHMDDEGEYIIDIHHDADNIVRVRIHSRHISSKNYFL